MLPKGSDQYGLKAQEAVDVAVAVLERRRGVYEGSRALARLAHDLVSDWRVDADFVVFGALDSESDRFPLGPVRERWSPAALAELDIERQEMEARAESDVMAACRSVVARFGAA